MITDHIADKQITLTFKLDSDQHLAISHLTSSIADGVGKAFIDLCKSATMLDQLLEVSGLRLNSWGDPTISFSVSPTVLHRYMVGAISTGQLRKVECGKNSKESGLTTEQRCGNRPVIADAKDVSDLRIFSQRLSEAFSESRYFSRDYIKSAGPDACEVGGCFVLTPIEFRGALVGLNWRRLARIMRLLGVLEVDNDGTRNTKKVRNKESGLLSNCYVVRANRLRGIIK